MADEQAAVDALCQLGLTEYEAKCFVALTRIPHGTAKEIAQVADIPRSRVYETMERLENRGLTEVQDGEPLTFQSVSVDAAIRILRKQHETYFETIERRLREVEPAYKETSQAVWAISDHEQVTERVTDIVRNAEEEITLLLLDESLLGEDLLDHLAEASERGVTVSVGTQSETVRDRIEGSEGDATVFTTELIDWFDEMAGTSRIGRVVMADRGPVLTSAVHGERLPGVPKETAAWSDGVDHGFATFVQRVLTYELKEKIAQEQGEPESS